MLDYETEITLQPTTDFLKVRYGLITPNGDLYACGYTDHCYLASELERIGVLNEDANSDYGGSVHVSSYRFDHIEQGYTESKRVTQRQLDTMFDYAAAHNNSFSTDGLEIIDARKTRKAQISPLRTYAQSSAV